MPLGLGHIFTDGRSLHFFPETVVCFFHKTEASVGGFLEEFECSELCFPRPKRGTGQGSIRKTTSSGNMFLSRKTMVHCRHFVAITKTFLGDYPISGMVRFVVVCDVFRFVFTFFFQLGYHPQPTTPPKTRPSGMLRATERW